MKKDLLIESGYDISSGGRRPELVGLNNEWGAGLGIEIGEGTLRATTVNISMDTLSEAAMDYPKDKNPADYVNGLFEKIVPKPNNSKNSIKKIGISVSESVKNPEEACLSIKKAAEKSFNISAITGRETLCRAFAEKILNHEAHGTEKILYINNDKGEGILLKDFEYFDAREKSAGYAYLKPWPPAFSIAEKAKTSVREGVGTKIVDISGGGADGVSNETIIDAAIAGDELATELIATAGLLVGVRIAYLINIFEPTLIIIGGGIERAGDIFFKPLKKSVQQFVADKMTDKIKIIPQAAGIFACSKGAGFLAIREIFLEA
ncbi:MAG: ROK family protein [Candidatus Omnitrophica bacterium]|nr:ROK family protein [Candidatus Omnitrophota bacterium]